MKFKSPCPLTVVIGGLLVLVAGCSKKTAEVPAPAPETTANPAAVQQPTTPAPTAGAAPDTRLAESQAALKAKNYDVAVAALITAQRSKLNEQQAAAAAAQMRQLQSSIAEAAAAGDPRAKAAADRLRQSALAR